jgi:hypothetical protein
MASEENSRSKLFRQERSAAVHVNRRSGITRIQQSYPQRSDSKKATQDATKHYQCLVAREELMPIC